MRNEDSRGSVTYVGPRAFAIAFCLVCGALAALFVGIDRFTEASATATLEASAPQSPLSGSPLSAAPPLPPTPAAAVAPDAAVARAAVAAAPIVSATPSETVARAATNPTGSRRMGAGTARIPRASMFAASSMHSAGIPPTARDIATARLLNGVPRPEVAPAHASTLTPGPARLPAARPAPAVPPRMLHTALVRHGAAGISRESALAVAAKKVQPADRIDAAGRTLLIPFAPARTARQASAHAAGAPATIMVDSKTAQIGSGFGARAGIIIAPAAPKITAPAAIATAGPDF